MLLHLVGRDAHLAEPAPRPLAPQDASTRAPCPARPPWTSRQKNACSDTSDPTKHCRELQRPACCAPLGGDSLQLTSICLVSQPHQPSCAPWSCTSVPWPHHPTSEEKSRDSTSLFSSSLSACPARQPQWLHAHFRQSAAQSDADVVREDSGVLSHLAAAAGPGPSPTAASQALPRSTSRHADAKTLVPPGPQLPSGELSSPSAPSGVPYVSLVTLHPTLPTPNTHYSKPPRLRGPLAYLAAP